MNPQDFLRLTNNFYVSKGLESNIQRINLDADLINYYTSHQDIGKVKHKIAFVFICLNPLYWQYAKEMVDGAKSLLLPGHQTDFFFWTDMPKKKEEVSQKLTEAFQTQGANVINGVLMKNELKVGLPLESAVVPIVENITNGVMELHSTKGINIVETEAVDWPYPTLLRYNLFLQEEQKLKDYDYIFYCDVDMRFVSVVGDEILGPGLTAAQHPMYALRKEYWPPYEPNDKSASYIKRPGKVVEFQGQIRFMPLYFAGGFQGGKADKFIEAMKETKKLIEADMGKNYIPIWNDETAWNKYLSENIPETILTPSYIYPDSLVKEYYEPLWGCAYQPKLMTLTKWFSLSKEGASAVHKFIQETKPLQ